MSSDRVGKTLALAVVLLATAVLAFGLFLPAASAEEAVVDPVDAILARLAESYAGLTSLQSDFVQTSSGMSYPEPFVQKGTLALEPPARLRWSFEEPRKQAFISDGSTLWVVDEGEKTCTIFRKVDQTITQFYELLTGMAKVRKEFRVSLSEASEARAGADSLKLVSRGDSTGLGTIHVHVSRDSGLVTAVTTLSPFGDRTELELMQIKTGVDLPDGLFVWTSRDGFQEIEGG
ncbi:MAG: outer membrane lipoprotein carrier protein LolA [Myxococcota bacterium]|nr:outer membrane lipoprotein carrier protein LolA [Myxococcota bacterium]